MLPTVPHKVHYLHNNIVLCNQVGILKFFGVRTQEWNVTIFGDFNITDEQHLTPENVFILDKEN